MLVVHHGCKQHAAALPFCFFVYDDVGGPLPTVLEKVEVLGCWGGKDRPSRFG